MNYTETWIGIALLYVTLSQLVGLTASRKCPRFFWKTSVVKCWYVDFGSLLSSFSRSRIPQFFASTKPGNKRITQLCHLPKLPQCCHSQLPNTLLHAMLLFYHHNDALFLHHKFHAQQAWTVKTSWSIACCEYNLTSCELRQQSNITLTSSQRHL